MATTTNVRNGPLTHTQKATKLQASPPSPLVAWPAKVVSRKPGCRPRDPAIGSSVWRMESAATQDGDLFLLSGHAGAIPRLSIEMALFYGGRRFCMVWDLKRGQNLLISFGGEIEIECWHPGDGVCSLSDSCFFVTLSMLLLWDARMDGRSWFRDGLFACHLAKRACRLLVAPFCWSTLLFCSEALRITAYY